jgi:hypothetical protein
MTCHAAIATLCIGGEASPVYIDNEKVWACGPCIAAATRLGMDPVADRRARPRIPAWRQRDLAKVLDHGRGAA